MSEEQREFVEIEPNVWKVEKEGDSVEGVLKKVDKEVGPNKSTLYHLEGEKQFAVWGSTVLDDRMAYVNEGDFVRITYKGTRENKRGQPTKIFKVEVAKQSKVTSPVAS